MTRTIFWCVALVFAFIAASCGKDTVTDKPPTVQSSSAPAAAPSDPPGEVAKPAAEKPAAKASFDHAAWDGLLKKYVTEAGPVKYQAWKSNAEDMKALNAYTGRIAAASLAELNKPEQLAFLINAYNAYTIQAVLVRYPISSVMKVEGDFFKGFKHKVAGEEMSLDTLENVKIREGFNEARIHFVVNCASASCPKLVRDAITPANMESLMETAAKEYIQKETRVDAKGGSISTSEIFKWFKGDFDKASGSVGAFLATRLEGKAAELAKAGKITYHPYGWALNEVK